MGGETGHATRRRRIRIGIAASLIAGALGYVVVEGLGSALVYFQTADQAVAHRSQLGSQNFNIEGTVVAGTVRTSGGDVDFEIGSKGMRVPVVNHGSPPQLFKVGIPVVLSGHFSGDTFVSSQIMVKHSAQYVAAHPDRVHPSTP